MATGLRLSVTVMKNSGIGGIGIGNGGLGNGSRPLKGQRRWRIELDEGVWMKWWLVVACDHF